jgi:hypothetical protein
MLSDDESSRSSLARCNRPDEKRRRPSASKLGPNPDGSALLFVPYGPDCSEDTDGRVGYMAPLTVVRVTGEMALLCTDPGELYDTTLEAGVRAGVSAAVDARGGRDPRAWE